MTMTVDMTNARAFRTALRGAKDQLGVRVSYTDILVKAVAEAITRHPKFNSSLDGDAIKLIGEVNVGIAVAIESGLIVPVVREAAKKSLSDISATRTTLIEKARNGTLSLQDVVGGTFTVTNLGMFGVETFTPIINPPQSAILGVGRMAERAMAMDGQLAVRLTMPLSLSFDHRIIDGAEAALFLQTVKGLLEAPDSLLEESAG
jgi:pyruvate dehydrogenase E2 component (dihydrolipoamide acetyltransferase)